MVSSPSNQSLDERGLLSGSGFGPFERVCGSIVSNCRCTVIASWYQIAVSHR
jgi:hypothetical protein